MRRLAAATRKEFIQFFRRKPLIVLVIWTIAIEIAVCAYSITYDVTHLRLAVQDQDGSEASRALISRFAVTESFDLGDRPRSARELDAMLETGRASIGLVIPADFSRRLGQGRQASVQLVLDGSNSNLALIALGTRRGSSAATRGTSTSRGSGRRWAIRGRSRRSGTTAGRGTTPPFGACPSRWWPC